MTRRHWKSSEENYLKSTQKAKINITLLSENRSRRNNIKQLNYQCSLYFSFCLSNLLCQSHCIWVRSRLSSPKMSIELTHPIKLQTKNFTSRFALPNQQNKSAVDVVKITKCTIQLISTNRQTVIVIT